MKGLFKHFVAAGAALLLGACGTLSGSGSASSLTGDVRATFTWEGSGHEGKMTAVLNTGETFSGSFFQITQDTRIETLDPLWMGWPSREWSFPWDRWRAWGPDAGFIKTYGGRVVANLQGANDTHMRCRFALRRPETGMSGGGEGICELPGGNDIDATFPAL